MCVCLCIKYPVWCFIPMLPSSLGNPVTWCFSSQALNELRSEGIPCVFTFGGEVQEPQAPPMPQSPGHGPRGLLGRSHGGYPVISWRNLP